MPPVIAAIAVTAAAAAGSAAASAGLSIAVTVAIEDAVGAIVTGAVLLGPGLVVQALTAPGLPSPEATSSSQKQATPARISGYGRAKLAGPYVRYTMSDDQQVSTDVFAFHDGLIDGFEAFYLNDDIVTVRGDGWVTASDRPDGRYSTYDKVQILTRTGGATETAFTDVGGAAIPGWTSAHRGDGIAQLALGCRTPLAKYYDTIYPNGLPVPGAVARLQLVYDPRDGGHRWTQNPPLALLDYLTNPEQGMGLSYARRIAGAVDTWKAAADDCDSDQDGAPRYRCGGAYLHTTAPADVIGALLASFDGWLGQTAGGALKVYSGRYVAPTVTLGEDAITGFSVQHGVEDENAINALVINYTSPANGWTTVEGESWRDEDSIADRGERSSTLDLAWVQDFPQARRLAKRQMVRLSALSRGTFTTNLAGLDALGERYVQLVIPELGIDQPVEISKAEIDLVAGALTFTWTQADPNVDEWVAEVETGTPPPVGDADALEPLATPTLSGVALDYRSVASGAGGVRLLVTVAALARQDVTFALRWRLSDGYWGEQAFKDLDATNPVVLRTDFVPIGETVHVEVAYGTGDGRHSDWCADHTVIADPNSKAALSAPTGVSAAGGATDATVSFDPVADAGGYVVAYSDTSGFDPADYGSGITTALSPAHIYGLPAGTYYARVAAYDAWRSDAVLLNFSTEASFVITTGGGAAPSGGGGGPSGGGVRCVAPETLVLMADGSTKAAGDIEVGEKVHTQHEGTGEWGDFFVFTARTYQAQERHAWNGLVAAPRHRVKPAGEATFKRLDQLGSTPLDVGPVVALTVADARTYVVVLPDGSQLLNHNIKASGVDG